MLINSEYSLEGLRLKLKLQYFGHQMQRPNSLKKTLMLGKMKAGEGDNRGWDGWMASPTQWTRVWANSRRWWRTGKPDVLQSMGSQRVRHDWVSEQLPSLPLRSCLHEATEQRSQSSSSGQSKKIRCGVGLPEVGEENIRWGWVSICTNSSHHRDEMGSEEVWDELNKTVKINIFGAF